MNNLKTFDLSNISTYTKKTSIISNIYTNSNNNIEKNCLKIKCKSINSSINSSNSIIDISNKINFDTNLISCQSFTSYTVDSNCLLNNKLNNANELYKKYSNRYKSKVFKIKKEYLKNKANILSNAKINYYSKKDIKLLKFFNKKHIEIYNSINDNNLNTIINKKSSINECYLYSFNNKYKLEKLLDVCCENNYEYCLNYNEINNNIIHNNNNNQNEYAEDVNNNLNVSKFKYKDIIKHNLNTKANDTTFHNIKKNSNNNNCLSRINKYCNNVYNNYNYIRKINNKLFNYNKNDNSNLINKNYYKKISRLYSCIINHLDNSNNNNNNININCKTSKSVLDYNRCNKINKNIFKIEKLKTHKKSNVFINYLVNK